jgi:hypothetical protein
LKKQIKYLISLLLVFGLLLTDGYAYSQPNSDAYYQVSNVFQRRESNKKQLTLAIFNQLKWSRKISFSILLVCLDCAASYSLRIPVLLKKQTQHYQDLRSISAQCLFVNEMSASKDSDTRLYIA